MTRIVIKRLVWDSYNIEYIKKHGVTEEEVENAVKLIKYHKHTRNQRYLVVCESDKRPVTIIVARKLLNTYYVVSARTAKRSERKWNYDK